jgi:hypothetical protein
MSHTWADPNLNDFYKRVARIEYTHARGHGFIAAGTLGRADFSPQKARRTPVLGPLLLILAFGFALKGAIHQQLGVDVFNARVAALMDSEGIDRLGGMLMQADPVTLMVSGQIDKALAPGGLLNVGD